MAVVMFWNTMGASLHKEIGIICSEYDVDIAIFAESKLDVPSLLEVLNQKGPQYFSPVLPAEGGLQFYTRYQLEWLEPRFDDGRISMRLLKHPLGRELLIVAVHLPSKLYLSNDEQTFYAQNLSDLILRQEKQLGHHRTMVIGDFNMDPFETGMIVANGLHAVMDKNIARVLSRVVGGTSYRLFYNPMWSRLGDESTGPSGTYYLNRSTPINYFWHTFDQVLMRPDLLEIFDPAGLHVVSRLAERPLLRGRGIDTSVSDHLPIVVRLDIERGR